MGTLKCRVLQLEAALDAVTKNYLQLKQDYEALKKVKDSLVSTQEDIQANGCSRCCSSRNAVHVVEVKRI